MIRKNGVLFLSFFLATLFGAAAAQAKLGEIPKCEGKSGEALAIDNERVLRFKLTTPNQFLERARVEGRVVRILSSRPAHDHFEIQIGSKPQDTLEVVFNRDFGSPQAKVGDEVEACGDYITSNAPTPKYQPSPSGAIIHWVHENSRGGAHPDGFVVTNDRLLHGFGRQPIQVDASAGSSDSVKAPPSSGRVEPAPAPAPAPVPAPVVSKPGKNDGKPAKEKERRRPDLGRDDPEHQEFPRHGRSWRDWVDGDKS